MTIQQNLLSIKSQLPKHVTLIAVSKTKPDEAVLNAYETGHLDFGENYVQELTDKYSRLPKDIRWHFIGHLQSNKVKYIAPFVYLIHGIDSFKLLKEINKEAIKNNRIIKCILQLFIADEETKFGLSEEEAETILLSDELQSLHGIEIVGLMAMASNTNNTEQIRNEFRRVKSFAKKHPQLQILSFGMSSDYQIAIEEGCTHIRIGSLIFGERSYSK
jgi:pyridoxal phosphate enzyme (YggS family)